VYSLESNLFHKEVLEFPHTAFRTPHPEEVYFDFDHLSPPLFIRHRREGDRFQPFGMNGTKKLKSVLIDDHIPKEDRDNLPLLCDQEGIVWMIKHRRSDRAKIRENTQRVLKVKVVEN
jgi:tRNA(Ile)-lysidine synthase